MNFLIRIVKPENVKPLRALLLEALHRDPHAFLATVTAELASSDEEVKTRIASTENSFIIGAFDDNSAMVG